MPKSERIELRATAEQANAIRARAGQAGLGVSDYVRRVALGEDLDAAPSPAAPLQSPPVGKASPSTAAATPAPSPEPVSEPVEPEPSPPAADGDLEARIAARARILYGQGRTRRQAEAQARRELA